MIERKEVIAFLTTGWADIDDRIRAGKEPGGVPSVSRIWTACRARGYDVHVFVTTLLERGWPERSVHLNGVTFHWIDMPLPALFRRLQRARLVGAAKAFSVMWQLNLIRRIRKAGVRPALIYLMRPSFAVVGWGWARSVGAKLVLRQYGTWLFEFWGKPGHLFQRFQTAGEYLAMRMPMDLFVMTNDGSRGDEAAKLVGLPMERFRFWLNGIEKTWVGEDERTAEAKKALGLSPDSPLILALGRLAVWKRLDRIIDAMPLILREVPKARLVIVGDGLLRKELERRAAERNVAEAVTFVGSVAHSEALGFLRACDVFAQLNDLTNVTNTLLEAMATGRCIVTRDVNGTCSVAKDGENAVVLSPGEAEDVASAVCSLLRDEQRRLEIGRRAAAWARANLRTWDERMDMEVLELERLVSDCRETRGQAGSGAGRAGSGSLGAR